MTLLLICVGCGVYAQSADDLFKEFATEKNAECITISSPVIKWVGQMIPLTNGRWTANVSSIRVLDMDECLPSTKERFSRKAARINLDGYEELMRVKDDDDRVRILMKQKKGVVHEILLLKYGKDDCTLIQAQGQITKKDVNQLVAMND